MMIGVSAAKPIPWRARRASAAPKVETNAMAVPVSPNQTSPKINTGRRPYRSEMTPTIGMTTMDGAVNADIMRPMFAVDAPSGSTSEPSTGERSAVPSGGTTLMSSSSWKGRLRTIPESAPAIDESDTTPVRTLSPELNLRVTTDEAGSPV
jgi:hypothetical protein